MLSDGQDYGLSVWDRWASRFTRGQQAPRNRPLIKFTLGVAQLGERRVRNAKVGEFDPLLSTNSS